MRFSLIDLGLEQRLPYRPNIAYIFGFGATYKTLTLNIGLNLPFNKKYNYKYGDTKHLDLQSHLYIKKYTIDVYVQFYKGFFLEDPQQNLSYWPSTEIYPQREDIRVINTGANIQYMFNYKKFNYRTIFTQDAWQKKSAGSWILGGDIYYITSRGDSSLVPKNISNPDFYMGYRFNKIHIFSIGPNGGYGHTFVVKKHWFLSLSFLGGVSAGFSKLYSDIREELNKTGITLNFTTNLRAGIGYNSRLYYIGLTYLNQSILNQAPVERGWISFDTGLFRLTLSRRFKLNKDYEIRDLIPGHRKKENQKEQ